MTIRTKDQLKNFFKVYSTPDENDFGDLVDSLASQNDLSDLVDIVNSLTADDVDMTDFVNVRNMLLNEITVRQNADDDLYALLQNISGMTPLDYYDKTEVDAAIVAGDNPLDARITVLEAATDSDEWMNVSSNYYNKSEVDSADNTLQTNIDNVSTDAWDHITNHPLGSVWINVSDQYDLSSEVNTKIDNVSGDIHTRIDAFNPNTTLDEARINGDTLAGDIDMDDNQIKNIVIHNVSGAAEEAALTKVPGQIWFRTDL